MSYNDGYASDASTNYEDVSDGESLSGSDLDEIEAIARVVRPQFVSDNDSIYTPAMNTHHHTRTKDTSRRTNPNQLHQKTKAPILDYRTMNQQKAKEEYARATNESKSSQQESVSPTASNTNKKEVIPQEAKLAFARDKNPQPVKINLGDLSAQVEEARRKKREADDEERRRLASLNSNRHNANYPNYHQNQKQPPNYEENERNSELEELKKKAVEEERKAATKAMAPSDLAKEIFIKSNNAEHQQNAEENSTTTTTTHEDKDGDVIDADHDVDTALEAVADEEEENLDERQEFYSFLDAINKNKTKDADRRTFLEPFSDESNTAAEQLGSLTLEERQRAMRVVNERNAKMYATLERIGHGGIASGVGGQHHHTNNDGTDTNNNNNVHQQSARRQGGGSSFSSSSSSKAIGTSTHDDDDEVTTEDHVRVKAEKELAFQNARAFIEGLLLQEKFIDSVNALLDRAVPAFRYTKYTRAAGEFTIEQHRQWELFCQEIEKMVLKKLQTIMDVAEFFERVFDEDEKEQEHEQQPQPDEEDEDSASGGGILSHDAWELILSVMKFEAFCSLMDSYIESAMDLDQEQQQGGDDDGKKQNTTPTVAADPGTKSAASNNNNKPRPKAALFHALPRSSNASSSLLQQQQQQQLGVRKLVVSSTSNRGGGGGELPSSMMQQQKLKAPRSAGSSSTTTTTSSIAQGSSMTYTNSRPALGARTSNK